MIQKDGSSVTTGHSPEVETILRRARKVAQDKAVDLDIALDAAEGGVLPPFLKSGWSWPEAWGCWSDGRTASFQLLVRVPCRCDLTAELLLHARVSQKTPEQTVMLTVNGQDNITWTFVSEAPVVKKVDIPAQGLRFGRALAALAFNFTIGSPEAPKALGTSHDSRLLGIGLRELRISARGNFA